MRITLVKKVRADGSPCRKCADVINRLQKEGLVDRIDRIVTADERDPTSEGMQLAAHHKLDLAPFFIVEDDKGVERVYTSYFRFLKEVLQRQVPASQENAEILERNPDLDYI